MAPSIGLWRKKEEKKIMKWENSHVFLLKKVGGAVFRGVRFLGSIRYFLYFPLSPDKSRTFLSPPYENGSKIHSLNRFRTKLLNQYIAMSYSGNFCIYGRQQFDETLCEVQNLITLDYSTKSGFKTTATF